jgi:isochorismate synthase
VSNSTDTPLPIVDPLVRRAIEQSIARVQATGQTHWLAQVIDADLVDGLRCYAHAGTRDRFYWERVDADESFCAWGAVDELETSGPGRFDDVRTWSRALRDRLDWIGLERSVSAPTLVGGFGFEDESTTSADWKAFPAARFVLPEVIVERRAGSAHSVLFVRVEPGASVTSVERALASRLRDVVEASTPPRVRQPDPSEATSNQWQPGPEYIVRADRSHAVFTNQVRAATREIEDGTLEKVVLARSLSVDYDGEVEIAAFMSRLRALYPTCTLIAVGRSQDTFLAATPETLVRVEGLSVETAALAGSAPRGRNPEEDRRLADDLLSSKKEIEEHEHVVRAIRDVLAPCCVRLEAPDTPRLRALFGIQHLETLIHGQLDEESGGQNATDLLGLVEALHPTPAVGGVPAESSRSWLRRFEGLERGWYAAPVGWLDVNGGGDFRVALRSALIRNDLGPGGESGASRTLLFAGAGIVRDSDPEAELAETRIKLRALLAPLTEI